MRYLFDKLSPKFVLLILVMVWIVPLLAYGFVGIVRLRRVYKGLQMPVYPNNRRGELFDWTRGPKTPRAALVEAVGSLCFAGMYSWLLTSPANRNSAINMLILTCGIAVFLVSAALDYRRFRKLQSKTPANAPQPSGVAR